MTKDISRREFLENIGLGAAAGTSLLLMKDVAHAQPGNAHPGDDQPSNDQPSAAALPSAPSDEPAPKFPFSPSGAAAASYV